MAELPASVRVALWVTHAWAGGTTLTDALERALPDVDHTEGPRRAGPPLARPR